MTVNTYSAAPIFKYVRTLFLTASGSECMATSEQIQNREEEDPHEVHEVPVQTRVFDSVRELLGVRLIQLGARSQQIDHHDHAADDVQRVQAGHREVDGQKR